MLQYLGHNNTFEVTEVNEVNEVKTLLDLSYNLLELSICDF